MICSKCDSPMTVESNLRSDVGAAYGSNYDSNNAIQTPIHKLFTMGCLEAAVVLDRGNFVLLQRKNIFTYTEELV